MFEDLALPQEILGIPELRATGAGLSGGAVQIQAEAVLVKGMCPVCGKVCTKVHQKLQRQVRHLPVFGRPCWIRFAHRQLECEGCGNTFAPPVGFLLTPDAQHTRAYAEWLYERVRGASIKVVAEQEGMAEKTLEGIYYRVAQERDHGRDKQGPEQT